MAFINISNHPDDKWSNEQILAARAMTRDSVVVTIPFPNVPANALQERIHVLACEVSDTVEQMLPDLDYRLDAFMVQGEYTLTHRLVQQLQKDWPGVPVVAACSERVVEEQTLEDGTTRKGTIFRFVQFREYF